MHLFTFLFFGALSTKSMLISILYSLWIAYTVGSLSVILFLFSLGLLAKWEKKKNNERIKKLLSKDNEYEDEGW
jgi:hypothetical protein